MNKTKKILLGILTVLPLVCLVLYFVFFFTLMFSISQQHVAKGPPPLFFNAIAMMFLMMLLNFGLMTFYIIHAFNNPKIPQDQKVLWTILVFFGNFVAMPIYWYLFIWKEQSTASAVTKTEA